MSDIKYKLIAIVDDEEVYEVERPTTAEIEAMFDRAEYVVERWLQNDTEWKSRRTIQGPRCLPR